MNEQLIPGAFVPGFILVAMKRGSEQKKHIVIEAAKNTETLIGSPNEPELNCNFKLIIKADSPMLKEMEEYAIEKACTCLNYELSHTSLRMVPMMINFPERGSKLELQLCLTDEELETATLLTGVWDSNSIDKARQKELEIIYALAALEF